MNAATRFYLGFSRVNGIGPARLERLIGVCGSVERAWHATLLELATAGIERRLAEELLHTRNRLDLNRELAQAQAAGITLIDREDAAYPAALAEIGLPPPLLFVRGQLAPGDTWGVAMVGTRSPSSYGRDVARRLSEELAAAGITITSGLAIGIDTLVHQGALNAGGRTLAILPCGVDMVYPERNRRLAAQICEAGALISEFPIGTRPIPQLFPVRNRLISALARAVVVVEARPGSGALITVEYALEQGRDVLAVPGPIYNPASVGPHQLIRNGAGLATSAADILQAIGASDQALQREVQAELPTSPEEQAILALLESIPNHIDDLARSTRLPVGDVSATLAMLELKGFVRRTGPMEYIRA